MKISQYFVQTFADGTEASYRTHRGRYLQFMSIWVTPLPAQSFHPFQYAAFLVRSLKVNSIPNYLNDFIGLLLHKEFNLPNPLIDNGPLQSL